MTGTVPSSRARECPGATASWLGSMPSSARPRRAPRHSSYSATPGSARPRSGGRRSSGSGRPAYPTLVARPDEEELARFAGRARRSLRGGRSRAVAARARHRRVRPRPRPAAHAAPAHDGTPGRAGDRRRAVARRRSRPGAALRPAARSTTGPSWLVATLRDRASATTSPAAARADRGARCSARCPSRPSARRSSRSCASIPRPALESIHRLSGGNPMYALELAREPPGLRCSSAPSARRSAARCRAGWRPRPAGSWRSCGPRRRSGPASPELLERGRRRRRRRRGVADAIDRGLLTLDEAMHGALRPPAARLGRPRRHGAHGAPRPARPPCRAGRPIPTTAPATSPWRPPSATRPTAARARGRRPPGRTAGRPGRAAELAAHSLRLTPLDDGRRSPGGPSPRSSIAPRPARRPAPWPCSTPSSPACRRAGERMAALTLRAGLDFGRADEVLAQAARTPRRTSWSAAASSTCSPT